MTADTIFELILFALVAKKLYEVARGWCIQDDEPLVTPPPRAGEEVPVRNVDELKAVSARAHFWMALTDCVDELVRRELGFLVGSPAELQSDVLCIRDLGETRIDVQICLHRRIFVKRVPGEVHNWIPSARFSAEHFPSATIWHIERWTEDDLLPWLEEIAEEVLYPSPEPHSSERLRKVRS